MNPGIPTTRHAMLWRVALVCGAVGLGAITVGGCTSSSNHEITCNSTEVAPQRQPGSDTAKGALDWYLENEADAAVGDAADYELTSSSSTRHVYANGPHQISVTALPADEGEPRVWVVLMTYDCT